MLKWQGDFTLPRLRAKLASKYRFHPNVEPDYAELYRPDLSHTVINRKDYAGPRPTRAFPARAATPGSPQAPFATRAGQTWSAGEAASERAARRCGSVPSLGLRRAVLPPSSLQPLPPGMTVKPSPSQGSIASAPVEPPEPKEPIDDPRALEKEKQAEMASRRFWVAADGNQHFLLEELCQIKSEDPTPSNQAILARLKSTQACYQMNKARKEGARVDWRHSDWDGATLLLKAVRTGSMALAMHLLAIGADPTLVDNSGRGVLHWVAIEGNAEMADYIFETVPGSGEQMDLPDAGGDTPLHLAAFHGHLAIVRLLVRAGADATRENSGGFTALQLAEAKRMWHVVTYLAEARDQQEDVSQKETTQLKDLLRPCNVHRASQVRLEWKDRPKPK